jgi:ubiquinone/menaquinone biosynthesis C-methylase UbiE
MSEAYVRHAKRQLKRWSRMRFIVGKAEAIPLPDNSQDAVTGFTATAQNPA